MRSTALAVVLALAAPARAECPQRSGPAKLCVVPCTGPDCPPPAKGPVTVTVGPGADQCGYLRGPDNCFAQALQQFDACAPPRVRAPLSVDGWCRYFDGTAVHSTYSEGQTKDDNATLDLEVRKNGKACFSLRRSQVGTLTNCKRSETCPREINTEITTRLGTVRYRQVYELSAQTAAYEHARRASHPPGTEVYAQGAQCFGEEWVGFLTCPNGDEVVLGYSEFAACEAAFPLVTVAVAARDHALDFAFTERDFSRKSIACGPHSDGSVALGITGIYFERPSPPIAERKAGPLPAIPPPGKK